METLGVSSDGGRIGGAGQMTQEIGMIFGVIPSSREMEARFECRPRYTEGGSGCQELKRQDLLPLLGVQIPE
jgi:hypothetical protein